MGLNLEKMKKIARKTTQECVKRHDEISAPLIDVGILACPNHELSEARIEELLKIVENEKNQRDQRKSKK